MVTDQISPPPTHSRPLCFCQPLNRAAIYLLDDGSDSGLELLVVDVDFTGNTNSVRGQSGPVEHSPNLDWARAWTMIST